MRCLLDSGEYIADHRTILRSHKGVELECSAGTIKKHSMEL